jgi:hypothetical protein
MLHLANCIGSNEQTLISIITHLAKFPVEDPVALVEQFWDELSIREYSEDDKDSMKKITRLFIFVELKYNLKSYTGGTASGLAENNHVLIEIGRGCLLESMTSEE